MNPVTDREYEELIASIRTRPLTSVSGVWFNLVRYGGCDFAQGDVFDRETGAVEYRPITVLAGGAGLEDIAGLWPDIAGHPIGRDEEAILTAYLSSRDGGDVELLVPERNRAKAVNWGRFDESGEFGVYSERIHPKIVEALDRISPVGG